ncbi:MAG: hypothetical protein EA350_12700 [Gemmatimonadales bacterium]|nr:MAG: hypothetical protein EA350_12700 [Gemmatimonadales bacterium]
MGFLDRDGERWACYLVTFQEADGGWRGFFAFRPGNANAEEAEIHTAHIFIEEAEGEIDRKARGLGRPLLSGLLASALHTREREQREAPALRNWFRDMLRRNATESGTRPEHAVPAEERTLPELRSLYDSYRLDQVVHLITLVDPDHFQEAVNRILDGRTFDFSTRDRLQFAMMVVEHLERLLALPPFEIWAEDYLANVDAYERYTWELHREGVDGEAEGALQRIMGGEPSPGTS